MGFHLKVTKGKSEGKEFSFTKPRVTVGRNHDNDLVLYDLNVSRHHFEIVLVQGFYKLRDSGSQNGTKLNDSPVVEGRLYDGDRIQIGGLEFVFFGSDTQPAIALKRPSERAEVNAPQTDEQRQTLAQVQTYAVNVKEIDKIRKTGQGGPVAGPLHKRDSRRDPAKDPRATHKRRPRWFYVAIAAGVAVIVMGVFAALYEKKPPDLSDRRFPIGSRLDPQSYGAGNVDISTPRRAQFVWKSVAGRALLTFTAGGIDRADEVLIELNGQRLMPVPVTGPAWGKETTIKLNRKLLKADEDNVVAFVAQPTSGEQLRWGVRELSLQEEALPPPSLEHARLFIKQADDALANRKIALGNLALAEEAYKKAILLMEGLEKQPPEYAKAEEGAKKASAELDTTMGGFIFNADRALKANRRDEAETLLREVLLYFPIPTDPRHIAIANRLEALGAK